MKVKHKYIEQNLYIPQGATSLIIGTFPSVLIRQASNNLKACDVNFFYGSCDNFFWSDLEKIFQIKFKYDWSADSVNQRKLLLDKLKLGITDIIFECETDGQSTDNALQNYILNEGIIKILDDNPQIIKIFFTSGSGKLNAEKETMRLLKEKARICNRKLTNKKSPKIRIFKFKGSNNIDRQIETITLYSPSPVAKRGGVTDEIRRMQYSIFLPKIEGVVTNDEFEKLKKI